MGSRGVGFDALDVRDLLVDEARYDMSSHVLQCALAERNIQTRPLWAPIHMLCPYRDCPAYKIETAERLYRDALSLPCSVGLWEADQERIIAALRDFAGGRR